VKMDGGDARNGRVYKRKRIRREREEKNNCKRIKEKEEEH